MRRLFHMLDGTTRVSEAWTVRHFYRRTVRKEHPRRTEAPTLEECLTKKGG